jgi:iron complex outermembrane receptor protein
MRLLSLAAACLVVVGIAVAAVTEAAAIKMPTNIPAQGLGPALKTLAKDRGFQVVFRSEVVGNARTQGAAGNLTTPEALTKLLEGTNLQFSYLDENTVTITSRESGAANSPRSDQTANNPEASSNKEAGKKSSQDFRLAQVDQGSAGPSQIEKKKEESKKTAGLEEIVVTGTRIPLASGQESAQPVRVYTRDDILKSGRTTMAGFLATLPDMSIAPTESISTTFVAKTPVRMHGLPTGTTLVLLDGQRVDNGYVGYVDVGNIPLSAIERVEVLPVGGSAVYGSDGLGGAINFILRKNFNGLESNVQYGGASGGSDEFNYDLAWGKSWERGSLSFDGNYQTRTELLGRERAVTSTPDYPSGARSFFATTSCYPGSVYSLNGQPLPGVGATSAGIPPGIIGTPTAQNFRATAGAPNYCTSSLYGDVLPPAQRVGALASGHYQLLESVDLFAKILYSREQIKIRTGDLIDLSSGAFGGTTLGAANPNNPFGETVGISYTYPGLGRYEQNDQSLFRPLLGLRGSLFGNWRYELTGFFSRDLENVAPGSGFGEAAITNAFNSSNPSTALNPFTSGAPGTPALLQSLVDGTIVRPERFANQANGEQGIVRGPLIGLPSGLLQAVFGVEHGRQKQDAIAEGGNHPVHLTRATYAGFTEVRAPLWADHEQPGAEDRLSLTAAGRYDHSDDFGGKTTWQGGIEFRPTSALLLRGGYATSYQAPTLNQLSGGILTYGIVGGGYRDPLRGNTVINAIPAINSGSNAGLNPETGKSQTLGLTYSSRELPDFKTSLTWYAIKISNYIATPDLQTLINHPELFPGAVVRGPLSPTDLGLGYTGGPISTLNALYYNFGTLDVSGVDLDLGYTIHTLFGQLTPSLAVTHTYKWMSAIKPGSPAVSYLGQANVFGTGFAPRWKGNVGLGWERQPLGVSLTGRYIGRYNDYKDTFAPSNSNILGNTWIVDTNIHIDLADVFASRNKWILELGAVNVFNRPPQPSYNFAFYDPAEADIRGRFLYARLGIKL